MQALWILGCIVSSCLKHTCVSLLSFHATQHPGCLADQHSTRSSSQHVVSREAAHQAAETRSHSNLPLAGAGLDARAAAIVMRTVRNIVNTGRTIVCTIHQPSIDIFESFDELLLLKRGGQTIYAGQLRPPCSLQSAAWHLCNLA